MELNTRKKGSFFIGELPVGCLLCAKGGKLVLLVTGKCASDCYYCPLSERKAGKDVTYANERRVDRLSQVFSEATLTDALGTGITGGDPLIVLDRTLRYISALKERFGAEHHIHLYTKRVPSEEELKGLREAGLDEIRFHVSPGEWPDERGVPKECARWESAVRTAKKLGLDTGMEVPCPPGSGSSLLRFCLWSLDTGADFVNLNELEMNYINHEELLERGFRKKGDTTSAVRGSAEAAEEVVRATLATSAGSPGLPGASIHFCSVAFKDGVQLRERLGRRAKNVMRPYHELTEDNTLIKGIIECSASEEYVREIREEFEIPEEMIEIDEKHGYVNVPWYVIYEIHEYLPHPCAIVEVYPTYDRTEMEREYLGRPR